MAPGRVGDRAPLHEVDERPQAGVFQLLIQQFDGVGARARVLAAQVALGAVEFRPPVQQPQKPEDPPLGHARLLAEFGAQELVPVVPGDHRRGGHQRALELDLTASGGDEPARFRAEVLFGRHAPQTADGGIAQGGRAHPGHAHQEVPRGRGAGAGHGVQQRHLRRLAQAVGREGLGGGGHEPRAVPRERHDGLVADLMILEGAQQRRQSRVDAPLPQKFDQTPADFEFGGRHQGGEVPHRRGGHQGLGCKAGHGGRGMGERRDRRVGVAAQALHRELQFGGIRAAEGGEGGPQHGRRSVRTEQTLQQGRPQRDLEHPQRLERHGRHHLAAGRCQRLDTADVGRRAHGLHELQPADDLGLVCRAERTGDAILRRRVEHDAPHRAPRLQIARAEGFVERTPIVRLDAQADDDDGHTAQNHRNRQPPERQGGDTEERDGRRERRPAIDHPVDQRPGVLGGARVERCEQHLRGVAGERELPHPLGGRGAHQRVEGRERPREGAPR
jgi:hypothetical protein